MAFQGKQPFFAFLQELAGGAVFKELAPAENFILDERVPANRMDDFLAFNDFAAPFSPSAWFKQHIDYSTVKVARAATSGTFDNINQPNWLAFQPDWDVVRIETIAGLCGRAPSSGVSEIDARSLIEEMLAARAGRAAMNPLREARLEKWLRTLNSGSDRRPAFVAPFAEVEDILKRSD